MLHDLTLSLPTDHPVFEMMRRSAPGPWSSGHVGTHLDSLLQTAIPLDWMNRSGVLIDVRHQGRTIGVRALSDVAIEKGDFVIFHTGHIAAHPYGTPSYFAEHSQLDWALITVLVERQVSFIGIDGPALRQGREEHAKVDTYCEERGTYVVENLSGLEPLAATEYRRFPMRLGWISHPGMTGIPIRVVAVTEA